MVAAKCIAVSVKQIWVFFVGLLAGRRKNGALMNRDIQAVTLLQSGHVFSTDTKGASSSIMSSSDIMSSWGSSTTSWWSRFATASKKLQPSLLDRTSPSSTDVPDVFSPRAVVTLDVGYKEKSLTGPAVIQMQHIASDLEKGVAGSQSEPAYRTLQILKGSAGIQKGGARMAVVGSGSDLKEPSLTSELIMFYPSSATELFVSNNDSVIPEDGTYVCIDGEFQKCFILVRHMYLYFLQMHTQAYQQKK